MSVPTPIPEESIITAQTNTAKTLRWWPALLLVVVVLPLPYLTMLFESPQLLVFMITFKGPGVSALLVVIWWMFASRASWREKFVGLGIAALLLTVGMYALDKSMQGMVSMFIIFPMAMAAFVAPLVLFAAYPKYRLCVAFACMMLTLGYWSMLRTDGTTGRFAFHYSWRWDPTAEQLFLTNIRKPS